MLPPDTVREVARLLDEARSALVITGAGLSADSGLPTYRGIGGLYDRATTDEGYAIEDALSGTMLRLQPEVCWKYIAQIEAACRGAKPNFAHEAIARLEARLPRLWVLTQNVDGLHAAAGSKNVLEIHGNVGRLHCTRCAWRVVVPDYSALELPPSCPDCGGLVRPAVVLFGEALPVDVTRRLFEELARGFDLVLSVGTTSAFPYIAEPMLAAARRGVPAVEINPGETEVSHVATHRLRVGAAEAFRALEGKLGALGA
jgi:NAD-dependent deacetylase